MEVKENSYFTKGNHRSLHCLTSAMQSKLDIYDEKINLRNVLKHHMQPNEGKYLSFLTLLQYNP